VRWNGGLTGYSKGSGRIVPNYRIVLTPQMATDIEEAIEYSYDHFGEATALKFSGAIETVKELIAMFLYITKIYDEGLQIRSFPIPGYPFTFYVRINDDRLEVIALSMTSQRRNPSKIKALLKERLKEI
jgi:plasmid stabilization system protein ParE